MTFFLLALAGLCIYGVTVYQKPDFNRNYLSLEDTMSIRGIFVLLIMASHANGYVELKNSFDTGYLSVSKFMSQTVVVMFLFYSGYGIMESIRRKGDSYIRQMPVKRLLITYINIVLALIWFFLAGNLLLGKSYSLKRFAIATIGWHGLGNSVWYIFIILFLYLVTWISFLLLRRRPAAAICLVTICCLVYVYIFVHFDLKARWWYNTIFCYPMGMWYSYFRERIERFVFRPGNVYYILLALSVFGVFFLKKFTGRHIAVYECWTLLFTAMVLLITMKVGIHNPILNWFGRHTFEIYILQRLPMNILKRLGLTAHPYRFIPIAFASTLVLAWLFGYILCFADRQVLRLFTRQKS